MDHIQELLNDARRHVHTNLEISNDTVMRLHDRVMRALPKQQKAPKKWVPATMAVVTVAAAAVAVAPQVMEYAQKRAVQNPGIVSPGPGPSPDDNAMMKSTENTDQPPQLAADSAIQKMSDIEKMTLQNVIPFGFPYEAIKNIAPELGEQTPEGGMESLGKEGLTEAVMPITVFGQQVKLEFNFKNNQMYATYFRLDGVDPQTAAVLEQKVNDFYKSTFGQPLEEKQTSGATSQSTNSWLLGNYSVRVTNSLNSDNNVYLSWGHSLTNVEIEKLADKQYDPDAAVLVGVRIGDTPEQVRNTLGTDYKEQATDGLHAGTTWVYKGIEVFFLQASNRVLDVKITLPGYKAPLGGQVGDKAEPIFVQYRAKFGNYTGTYSKDPLLGWYEIDKGVLLIFDADSADGKIVNENVNADSTIQSVRLVSRQMID